jgi:hypothetical protein
MFPVICFDDRPAAVRSVMASPFKVMKISRRVDFPDNGIAVTGIVRGFN